MSDRKQSKAAQHQQNSHTALPTRKYGLIGTIREPWGNTVVQCKAGGSSRASGNAAPRQIDRRLLRRKMGPTRSTVYASGFQLVKLPDAVGLQAPITRLHKLHV